VRRKASGVGDPLSLSISHGIVVAIAEEVVDLLVERLPDRPEPWLDVAAAAAYLACDRHRVYDLVAANRLRCARDGRRLLFKREWLDGCLEHTSTRY
jgi:excisionase family DNA binding protein